jgi:hypothetical protein
MFYALYAAKSANILKKMTFLKVEAKVPRGTIATWENARNTGRTANRFLSGIPMVL